MSRFFAFSWLKAAKRHFDGSSKSGRGGKGLRPARFIPRLEELECRNLLSTFTA
jgi:hypothetical protein